MNSIPVSRPMNVEPTLQRPSVGVLNEDSSKSEPKSRVKQAIIVAIAVVLLVAVGILALNIDTTREIKGINDSAQHVGPSLSNQTPSLQNQTTHDVAPETVLEKPTDAPIFKIGKLYDFGVAKLGSPLRMKLLVGFVSVISVAIITAVVFLVIFLKNKSQPPLLPTVEQVEVVQPFSFMEEFPKSTVFSKILFGLSALSFVCLTLLFLFSASVNYRVVMLLSSIIISLIAIFALAGLWKMGAFANFTLLLFIRSSMAPWLILSAFVWLAIIAVNIFKDRKEYSEKTISSKTPLHKSTWFIISLLYALIVTMIFGALGAGGGSGAAVALLISVILFIATIVESRDSRSKYKVGVFCGEFILLAASIIFVYFGTANGVVASVCIVSFYLFKFMSIMFVTHSSPEDYPE